MVYSPSANFNWAQNFANKAADQMREVSRRNAARRETRQDYDDAAEWWPSPGLQTARYEAGTNLAKAPTAMMNAMTKNWIQGEAPWSYTPAADFSGIMDAVKAAVAPQPQAADQQQSATPLSQTLQNQDWAGMMRDPYSPEAIQAERDQIAADYQRLMRQGQQEIADQYGATGMTGQVGPEQAQLVATMLGQIAPAQWQAENQMNAANAQRIMELARMAQAQQAQDQQYGLAQQAQQQANRDAIIQAMLNTGQLGLGYDRMALSRAQAFNPGTIAGWVSQMTNL